MMPNESSIIIFERASLMLAEADTIQKVKEFKSLALTAADLAKRKGLGEKAVQYARSYALEAERKLGEMLAKTERNTGAKGIGKSAVKGDDRTPPKLSDLGLTKQESSRAQKLARLPQEKFDSIRVGDKTIKEILSPAHVANNSGENEWYTPREYVEAARAALGSIDLDPASSEIANKTVRAKHFFSITNDGLKQKWGGNVWMNPPYAQPLISQFAEAVSVKFVSGEINAACVLVNNATETAWFQAMLKAASAVCFPSGRIKFIDKDGNPSGAPLQGQAILYLGDEVGDFTREFSRFGVILRK